MCIDSYQVIVAFDLAVGYTVEHNLISDYCCIWFGVWYIVEHKLISQS